MKKQLLSVIALGGLGLALIASPAFSAAPAAPAAPTAPAAAAPAVPKPVKFAPAKSLTPAQLNTSLTNLNARLAAATAKAVRTKAAADANKTQLATLTSQLGLAKGKQGGVPRANATPAAPPTVAQTNQLAALEAKAVTLGTAATAADAAVVKITSQINAVNQALGLPLTTLQGKAGATPPAPAANVPVF